MTDLFHNIANYRDLIREYAQEMPKLLIRHPATADIALEIEQLRLTDVLNEQFTVAVIGQMRSGKSTLINALIGRDLTPVAINETTATINWIRYAHRPEDVNIFRVHWNSGEVADYPLSQINEWIGQSQQAAQTRFIEFFALSEFLKRAAIVDTPGTRAVMKEHTTAAADFLAEKLEEETLLHGGRADAVVYVINPVAREFDLKQLVEYGNANRLPGSSPLNSMCVAQKWEHLEGDPLAEAQKKCCRMRDQFRGQVSEVLPTSGLLARAAAEIPEPVLSDLIRLVTGTAKDQLELLTMSDEFFVDPCSSSLDVARRKDISHAVPWPALRMTLQLIRDRQLKVVPDVRCALREVSGIDALQKALHERFFAQAEMIRANKILKKAVDPFKRAVLKLRDQDRKRTEEKNRGETILAKLPASGRNATVQEAMTFIETAIDGYFKDAKDARDLLSRIAEHQTRIQEAFDLLDTDLQMRTLLLESDLDIQEKVELRRLFGADGLDIRHRLGIVGNSESEALRWAEERLTFWNGRTHRCRGERKQLCESAAKRYGDILNAYESNTGDRS